MIASSPRYLTKKIDGIHDLSEESSHVKGRCVYNNFRLMTHLQLPVD